MVKDFLDDKGNGTGAEKLKFVIRKLTVTTRCHITTIDLCLHDNDRWHPCRLRGQDAERLATVLALRQFHADGAGRLETLAPCQALAYLDLSNDEIGDSGAERLTGVLGQSRALAHLNLGHNYIGAAGAKSLAGVLTQCPALAHLNLKDNLIGADGAGRLAVVLPQCPALTHLDLSRNTIGDEGAGSLAGVLTQCRVLAYTYLDLSGN